jgi:membrane associated rhomboid family serine protease
LRPMRTRRAPFGASSMAVKLALALVAGSLIFALTQNNVGPLLLLRPAMVLRHLMLWQVVTYTLIEVNALNVLIGAFVLWSLGAGLEMSWGPKRLLGYSVGIATAAGVITVLLSLVPGLTGLQAMAFPGGSVMVSALWVAYGLSFGRAQTNFFGMPVSGNTLAWIGVLFVVLNGAFAGSWLLVVPDAIALVITFLLFRVGSPHSAWLRFQSWRLQKQLHGRSKHLKLVGKDRNHPADSDRYLH